MSTLCLTAVILQSNLELFFGGELPAEEDRAVCKHRWLDPLCLLNTAVRGKKLGHLLFKYKQGLRVCTAFWIKKHRRKLWVNWLCNSCCLLSLGRGRFWLIAICCSEKDEAERCTLAPCIENITEKMKQIFCWPENTESSQSSGAVHWLWR